MTERPEIYPMPSFATLTVRDLARSLRWYEALGFQNVFAMPMLAHLRWVKYADLLLRTGPAPAERNGAGITLSYAVAADIDALAARAKAADATFLQEPGDRPWNARDFTLADPDGFALTFTMGPLKRDVSFEDVMKDARGK